MAVLPISFLQFVRRTDSRHLNQDAVFALALDRGFTGSRFVDTAADDFQRLLHRALIGRLLFRGSELDDDVIALDRHCKRALADTGQRHHAPVQGPDRFDSGGNTVGIGQGDAQDIVGRRRAANGADLIAQILQSVADFGPKSIHPHLVDILDTNFGQQMRATAQVKTKVDDA